MDGRPISRSSSSLTRVASVYLAGGRVSCPLAASRSASSGVALGQRRQPALPVVALGVGIVRVLDVRLEEPVEADDLAGRAELGPLAGGGRPATRTDTDSPVASFIWEATVRFQTSS